MPFKIELENLPAGYSMSAVKGGGKVEVAVSGFYSSEDGDEFIQKLEGFPNEIISKLPMSLGIRPSTVDHLIVIIDRDKTATVYVNEITFLSKVQVTRSVAEGEPVRLDDIADIHSIIPKGVEIPKSSGLLILISVGWRKGLFFDFFPLQFKNAKDRDFDIHIFLGQIYSYLLFQNRFKISEMQWNEILKQGWFPFISLGSSLVNDIINYAKNSWNIDDLINKIKSFFDEKIDNLEAKWCSIKMLESHSPFIQKAISHYKAQDYLSSISVLYPRIEGIMRDYHLIIGSSEKATQSQLVETIVKAKDPDSRPYSLLLPDKFREFLSNVYFANFDPQGKKPLSRHSVSHGVADVEDYSLKGSIVGFLCLDQLSFYLSGHTKVDKANSADTKSHAAD